MSLDLSGMRNACGLNGPNLGLVVWRVRGRILGVVGLRTLRHPLSPIVSVSVANDIHYSRRSSMPSVGTE